MFTLLSGKRVTICLRSSMAGIDMGPMPIWRFWSDVDDF
jgi:hypothetical protein